MHDNKYRRRFAVFALGFAFLVTGCASGSNTPPQIPTAPTPPPAPPPPPPTPPPPDDTDFDTTEFQTQTGLAQINALPALEAGALGQDTIVAIIDTGIDLNNPEFQSRLHPQSADLVVAGIVPSDEARAPSLQDEDDHGTPIASIIGAERNNSSIHGVAPSTELLVFRADDDGPEEEVILGGALVEGIRRSATIGVESLNLSLGSNEDGARDDFRFLLSLTSDADIVTAIAAGNESADDPDLSALGALDVIGAPATIIVGAVNSNNNLAGFSNAAGIAQDIFLVAPGVSVQTVRINTPAGAAQSFSGTSASTPHVAGAAAALRSLWPMLTAAETVEILLDTATDLGAPGTDPIFGRGLLNLGAAIEPVGDVSASSVNGTSISIGDINATLSPVFGSGFSSLDDIVVVDRFNRDFRANLNGTVGQSAPDQFNIEAKFSPFFNSEFSTERLSDGTSLTLQLSERDRTATNAEANLFARFNGADAQTDFTDERLSFALTQALNTQQSLTVAQGFSPRSLDRLINAQYQNPFIGDAGFRDLYLSESISAFSSGLRHKLGEQTSADILISYANDDEQFFDGLVDTTTDSSDRAVTNLRIGLTRQSKNLRLRFENGLRRESGAILGADFGADANASTFYSAINANWKPGTHWGVSARYAAGYTVASANGFGGFIGGFSDIVTSQFAVALERRKLFQNNDRFNVGVSQPLRAESGAIDLILPTEFDRLTGETLFSSQSAPLAQTGRALDFEASYAFSAGPLGVIDFNLIHQLYGRDDFTSQTTALIRTRFDF